MSPTLRISTERASIMLPSRPILQRDVVLVRVWTLGLLVVRVLGRCAKHYFFIQFRRCHFIFRLEPGRRSCGIHLFRTSAFILLSWNYFRLRLVLENSLADWWLRFFVRSHNRIRKSDDVILSDSVLLRPSLQLIFGNASFSLNLFKDGLALTDVNYSSLVGGSLRAFSFFPNNTVFRVLNVELSDWIAVLVVLT